MSENSAGKLRRVDQILSSFGYCSRREARSWCNHGRVICNGEEVSDFSQKVRVADLLIDDEPVDHPDGILIMLNKPVGYVCSHEDREGLSVYSLLPEQWLYRDPQMVSVGRLDKDTSGLLIITDQHDLVHRLTSPKHHVDKIYIATVDKDLQPEMIKRFAHGMHLKGETKPCLPAGLEILDARTAKVTIREGKFHQVRRMFAAFDMEVQTLQRIQLGALQLGELEEGEWIDLPDAAVITAVTG